MFDGDDGGLITFDDLKKAAEELEQHIKPSEIKLMLKIADRDNKYGGEEVDYADFMYLME